MLNKNCFVIILLPILMLFAACTQKEKSTMNTDLFNTDNLFAWCIVPYDSLNRTPEQRAEMLHELGLHRYAYDWRPRHLEYMDHEMRVMQDNNIEITSVWFWIDGGGKQLFDQYNERILSVLQDAGIHTNLWISFPERFYDGIPDEQKFAKAVKAIDYAYGRAREIGCTVSLYNHGGWFGEIENQLKIIKALGYDDIGITYNFLRGTSDPVEFKHLMDQMLPYLREINLNGTKELGITDWSDIEVTGPPYVLTLGEGDREQELIRIIAESGFTGPIGIIGHTWHEDVQDVIRRNMDGLQKIVNGF